MTTVALILFWFSVGLIVYTYVLYPVLLILRSLLFPASYQTADITPSVSLIIAAYNEAENIEDRIKNILSLDYPAEKLEAVIASDGSDDGTAEIVSRYTGDTIKLIDLPRQGKADAMNAAVEVSSGDILVFSDANSQYAPNAIRKLVRPFADSGVGGVAGNQEYTSQAGNFGEKSYWSFDRQLKRLSSRGGNTISATGAIYAIRRTLFLPVPRGVTDDFTTSTRVVAQGYRLVFEPDAISYEPAAKSHQREFGRKLRVISRGLRSVIFMRELLNPFRFGFYSVQVFTHKLLRRLLFAPLIVIFLTLPFLWGQGLFYKAALVGHIIFYALALLGWQIDQRGIPVPKLLAIPTYVCMVYLAALLATWNLIRGHRIAQWSTERS